MPTLKKTTTTTPHLKARVLLPRRVRRQLARDRGEHFQPIPLYSGKGLVGSFGRKVDDRDCYPAQ